MNELVPKLGLVQIEVPIEACCGVYAYMPMWGLRIEHMFDTYIAIEPCHRAVFLVISELETLEFIAILPQENDLAIRLMNNLAVLITGVINLDHDTIYQITYKGKLISELQPIIRKLI